MRKGILNKPTDNKVYLRAFRLLREHGIRPVSFNMLGLPGEKKHDIFRTMLLNRLSGTRGAVYWDFLSLQRHPDSQLHPISRIDER